MLSLVWALNEVMIKISTKKTTMNVKILLNYFLIDFIFSDTIT